MREIKRLEVVLEMISTVEAERDAILTEKKSTHLNADKIKMLAKLKAIGAEFSTTLVGEVPSSLEPFALAERMRDPGTGKTRPNMSLLRRQPSRSSGLRLGFTFRVHHSAIALNRGEIDNR